MAALNRTELKDRVAQRIDEVIPNGNTEKESIVEGSYDLIDDELDQAARMTLTNAPQHLVYPAGSDESGNASISIDSTTLVATITLPSDFLRFIRCKLSGTERPIFELLTLGSPMYKAVHNKVNGGHYQRPIGFLAPSASGSGYIIEIFRAKTDTDTISELICVTDTVAENVPEDLQDAVIDYAAYRVLLAMKQGEFAKMAYEGYVQVLSSVKKGVAGE